VVHIVERWRLYVLFN